MNTILKKIGFIIIALVCFSILVSCNNDEYIEKSKLALGTVISVKVCGKNAEDAINEAFLRVSQIENEMSAKKQIVNYLISIRMLIKRI